MHRSNTTNQQQHQQQHQQHTRSAVGPMAKINPSSSHMYSPAGSTRNGMYSPLSKCADLQCKRCSAARPASQVSQQPVHARTHTTHTTHKTHTTHNTSHKTHTTHITHNTSHITHHTHHTQHIQHNTSHNTLREAAGCRWSRPPAKLLARLQLLLKVLCCHHVRVRVRCLSHIPARVRHLWNRQHIRVKCRPAPLLPNSNLRQARP